jgi:hypothetical protein
MDDGLEATFTWQDGLFKFASVTASCGTVVLFGIVLALFVMPGMEERFNGFVKPLTMGATFAVLVLTAGVFNERETISHRLPACRFWIGLIAVVFGMVVCGALFPLGHPTFILVEGIMVLLAISVFRKGENRLRLIAVCDLLLVIGIADQMRQAGAWKSGRGMMPSMLFLSYAFCGVFLPLCLIFLSFVFAPILARVVSIMFAAMGFQAGAVVFLSAGVWVDEYFGRKIAGLVDNASCFRPVELSAFQYLIMSLGQVNVGDPLDDGGFEAPPSTIKIDAPCLHTIPTPAPTVWVSWHERDDFWQGSEAVVFAVLVAAYVFAMIVSCIVCPMETKVSPMRSSSKTNKGGAASNCVRHCRSIFVSLGRSTMRLVCVLGFLAGAFVLFLFFTAAAYQRNQAVAEGSVDTAGRRLESSMLDGASIGVLSAGHVYEELDLYEDDAAVVAAAATTNATARRLQEMQVLTGAEEWPWASSCWEYGVDYGVETIWTIDEVPQRDLCQKLCRNHTGCTHITYVPDDLTCHLKPSDFGREYHTNGISGPAYCPGYPTPAPENETMEIDIGCNPGYKLAQKRYGEVEEFDWYAHLNISNESRIAELMNGSLFPYWMADTSKEAYTVPTNGVCVDEDGVQVKYIYKKDDLAVGECEHECNLRNECEGYAVYPDEQQCNLYGGIIQQVLEESKKPEDDRLGQLALLRTTTAAPVANSTNASVQVPTPNPTPAPTRKDYQYIPFKSGRSELLPVGGEVPLIEASPHNWSCYVRNVKINTTANVSTWLNLSKLEVNGTLGVPFCGELSIRRRRSKEMAVNENMNIRTEFDGKAGWNCTNQTWCEENITDEEGKSMGSRCMNVLLMDGSISLCGACPNCMPPCPAPPTTITTTPRPLQPLHAGWAFIPVEQMIVRFCDVGSISPLCIYFFLYLLKCYGFSLVSSIARAQNLKKAEQARMEERKRSRELGLTVEEMQKRKESKKKGGKAVERNKASEFEPPPPSKGEIRGGRIFGV